MRRLAHGIPALRRFLRYTFWSIMLELLFNDPMRAAKKDLQIVTPLPPCLTVRSKQSLRYC